VLTMLVRRNCTPATLSSILAYEERDARSYRQAGLRRVRQESGTPDEVEQIGDSSLRYAERTIGEGQGPRGRPGSVQGKRPQPFCVLRIAFIALRSLVWRGYKKAPWYFVSKERTGDKLMEGSCQASSISNLVVPLAFFLVSLTTSCSTISLYEIDPSDS
jgi:hypothetical protein